MDLRTHPWIPWLRRDLQVEWESVAHLVDGVTGDNPIVGIASPRPDFDGALQEFLIGLMSAAFAPGDDDAWFALWQDPPTPQELTAALLKLPQAFELDGEGPRFLQDLAARELADQEVLAIDRLLIDSPGDQGIRLNTDLFVKRGRIEQLGRPAAALALLAMQTYAPSGGQGHRTSLRGGGPLTTLIDPRVDEAARFRGHEQSLWRKLWANVETGEQLANRASSRTPSTAERIFPWLAPTRTSNTKSGGKSTTPGDAHPLQAYFGLPRRIRLEFGDAGQCDLTGRHDERTVIGLRMLNYGVEYRSWRHPLSPYRRSKASDDEWIPVHGQPGGIGWRDWMSLALEAPSADRVREPALVVTAFTRRGPLVRVTRPRIHAFGYDVDNMKARGWVDASLPGVAIDDPVTRKLLYDTASALVDGAGHAATALFVAVRETLFQSGENAAGDIGEVKYEMWDATEAAFYDAIGRIADPGLDHFTAANEESIRLKREFLTRLEEAAFTVFDRWCPPDALKPGVLRRRVSARYNLGSALRGYSKLGEKLFDALGIPRPGGGREARAVKKKGSRKSRTIREATE
jgi:CRISPR system Cascade subunit CasA